jgi:AcrR family transcriptional regulator
MARRPRTSPRRLPKQARSRDTVEVLLEGTARVLVREGYDRASTNRIAEAAGVNISSLYQYFPSKEALVAALIDRHLERVAQAFSESFRSREERSLEEQVRTDIRAQLALSRLNPALYKVVLEQVPRVDRLNPIVKLRRLVIAETHRALEAQRAQIRVTDLERAAFVVVHLVEALTNAAILERPELLADEAYVDEMVRAVLAYLGVAPKPSDRPPGA